MLAGDLGPANAPFQRRGYCQRAWVSCDGLAATTPSDALHRELTHDIADSFIQGVGKRSWTSDSLPQQRPPWTRATVDSMNTTHSSAT